MGTVSKKSATRYSEEQLQALVEEATVDCYDEDEQAMGLAAMIEENLALPFETTVLGMSVTVESVEEIRSREIAAICRQGGHRQAISLADLPLPSPPPDGSEWIAAYRHWLSRF